MSPPPQLSSNSKKKRKKSDHNNDENNNNNNDNKIFNHETMCVCSNFLRSFRVPLYHFSCFCFSLSIHLLSHVIDISAKTGCSIASFQTHTYTHTSSSHFECLHLVFLWSFAGRWTWLEILPISLESRRRSADWISSTLRTGSYFSRNFLCHVLLL